MLNRNVKSVELFITKAPTTLGQIPVTDNSYTKFKVEPFDVPLPDLEMLSDGGTVGDGVGYEQNLWVYRSNPVSLTLRGKLENTLFPILFARTLGGTPVDTAVTSTTSYDHVVPMATELELVEPKLSCLGTKGQADFLWGDMYPRSLTISQNKDEHPMFECELSNTGNHKRISDTALAVASIPSVASDYYAKQKFHGAATTLVFNNGAAQDLTASRGLISVTARLTQPCETVNLPGDPYLTTGDPTSGSYAGTVQRQTQDQDIITMRVYTNSTLGRFMDLKNNTVLTNLVLKFQGAVIGATTDRQEVEVKLTRCQIVAVKGATEGEYEALDVTIKALPDSTTKRLAVGRIRDGKATLA